VSTSLSVFGLSIRIIPSTINRENLSDAERNVLRDRFYQPDNRLNSRKWNQFAIYFTAGLRQDPIFQDFPIQALIQGLQSLRLQLLPVIFSIISGTEFERLIILIIIDCEEQLTRFIIDIPRDELRRRFCFVKDEYNLTD
ncbi:hypothetical protein PMAYCL1PPCAC_09631, partial [Pristionchus mayeri]